MALALAWLPMAAVAQDYPKGWAAFRSGDFATALQEWQPLADQGDANAQNNFGGMYDNGQGVPQDFVIGHMWFNIASSNGGEDSGTFRDAIAEQMTVEQIAEAQRRASASVNSTCKDCD